MVQVALPTILLLLAALTVPRTAFAQHDEGGSALDAASHDSTNPAPHRNRGNGPRNVAHGTDRERTRARRLRLGTEGAGRQLINGRPRASWVVAAGGGRAPHTFLWPVLGGVLTQGFNAMGGTHRALDIAAPCGTTIRAAHAGIVGYSDNGLYGLGNAVVIIAAGGIVSAYGHTRRTLVAAGALVHRGDAIAEVGDTGRAHGCHVHFMVIRQGERVDPASMMIGGPHRDHPGSRPPRSERADDRRTRRYDT